MLSSESGLSLVHSIRAEGLCKPCACCGFLQPICADSVQVPLFLKATWMGPLGQLQLSQKLEKCCRKSHMNPLAWLKLRSSLSLHRIVMPGCYELLNRCCSAPSEGCISLGEEMNPFNSGHNL